MHFNVISDFKHTTTEVGFFDVTKKGCWILNQNTFVWFYSENVKVIVSNTLNEYYKGNDKW